MSVEEGLERRGRRTQIRVGGCWDGVEEGSWAEGGGTASPGGGDEASGDFERL